MKVVLAICLLLISMHSVASAQQKKRASLTRSAIKEAERKLNELGYWTGPVDGVLDTATKQALIAFQKWEGRPITGKLTVEETRGDSKRLPRHRQEISDTSTLK